MATSLGFQNISFHISYVFTFPFKGSVLLDLVVELRMQYYGDIFEKSFENYKTFVRRKIIQKE